MLIVQLNFFMLLLLSGISVHAWYKLDRKDPAYQPFFRLLSMTMLILLLEIFSDLLNSELYLHLIALHKMIDMLGFLLAPVVPVLAVLYVYKRICRYKKIPAGIALLLSLPFVANAIFSVGSIWFHWIFTIDADNLYQRGPLFFISPLACYFYYFVNAGILLRVRDRISREELLVLSLFTIVPAILSVVQLYYFIYLTIWNSIAVAVVINYIFIVNSQIKIDPLTRLGNRIAYTEYLAVLGRKTDIVLAVINMDLDDFKTINDTCGHQEGDLVLQLFAGQMESVFGENGLCIRWGGDEFMVLLRESRLEIIESYIAALNRRIDRCNEERQKPYQIRFSAGVAVFNDSCRSFDALIEQSDKLMYAAKNQKRARK